MNRKTLLFIISAALGAALMLGCEPQPTGGLIKVSGRVLQNTAAPGLFRPQGENVNLLTTSEAVDNVIAFTNSSTEYVGQIDADGNFSVSLEPGKIYLLAFYEGTLFRFAYGYSPEGLESLPLTATETDISLGDLEINGNLVEPTTDPLTGLLGITEEETAILSEFDQSLFRLVNVDVDRDGVFDFEQEHRYDFFPLFWVVSPAGLSTAVDDFLPATAYQNGGFSSFFSFDRPDLPPDKDPDMALGMPVARVAPPVPFELLKGGIPLQPNDYEDTHQGTYPGSTSVAYIFFAGQVVSPVNVPAGTYQFTLLDGYRTDYYFKSPYGPSTMEPYPEEESGVGS